MKNQIKYFILGIILILFSTPLGELALNIVYANKNLVGAYEILLKGFIYSFMLVGVLIFVIGLVDYVISKKHSH